MERFIKLRNFEDTDLLLFKKWLFLPHVAQWYHDPLDWMMEVENRNFDYTWLHHFIAEKDGRAIGFCQYYEYINSGEVWHGNTEVSGLYSIDYMIGEADSLKKGFGKSIVHQLVTKIRTHQNARRVIVQPEPENTPSCRTLLACGFYYDAANEIYVLEL